MAAADRWLLAWSLGSALGGAIATAQELLVAHVVAGGLAFCDVVLVWSRANGPGNRTG